MRAMVLAAGLGTRLRPLTDERAKPAVPVANVPLIAYSLLHLADFGVRDVVINAHHLPETIERAVAPYRERFATVTILREPVLLGTGGGIRAALPLLDDDDDVLVMNGDILFAPDLARAVVAHRAHGAIATMVVRDDANAATLGAIGIDAEGVVRRLLGTPDPGLHTTMFTGVHVLSSRALREVPEEGCIIRKSYRSWIDRGEIVAGVVETAPFRDLGTKHAYLEGNLNPPSLPLSDAARAGGKRSEPNPPRDRNRIGGEVRMGKGVRLIDVVIGDGATIADGVTLERVVVWDGVHVESTASDAIITARGVVQV